MKIADAGSSIFITFFPVSYHSLSIPENPALWVLTVFQSEWADDIGQFNHQ